MLRELGCNAEAVESGLRALEKLRAGPLDIVFLDIRMPGMDGMEVLRRVKETYPQVAVIIMTGHGSS